MNTVKLNKSELLLKVKANREIHAAEYQEAKVTYTEKLRNALLAKLEETKGESLVSPILDLILPEVHLKDYDRVIAMLENSIDEYVELTSTEFDQYWMDEWRWMAGYLHNNRIYSRTVDSKFADVTR